MDTPTLSHITLRARDRAHLGQALAFYGHLGFSIIRHDQDDNGHWLVYLPPTSLAAPNNYIPKATAPLVPASGGKGSGSPAMPSSPVLAPTPSHAPATPRRVQKGDPQRPQVPATIHLRVADQGSVAGELVDMDTEKLHGAPVSLVFTTADLVALEKMCLARQFKCKQMTRDDGGAYLYVADPLGNVVVFTTKAHPFSSHILQNSTTSIPSATLPDALPYAAIPHHATESTSRSSEPVSTTTDADAAAPAKRIGVLTSGGDSQGMNAAVRSVVRMAILKGMQPYAVYDGYQGLVDNRMVPFGWADVQGLLRLGGTVIGSARCMAFRERAGRLTGAKNLVDRGIDALVVVGGDGSLTGADRLRAEWPSLLDELLATGRISQEQRNRYAHLTIVGLVGSIDNDMSSTDMTIGCASALHRICEAIDAIEATALSHGRAFVVEVMGRHCGWLALMAALATGADWLFVPERPALVESWQEAMVKHLQKLKDRGQKKMLVIVSEGAIDRECNPIKPDEVRDVLAKQLGLDARVTTLGHVQRGGSPAFYDRYLGTVQGVRAVEEILRSTPETPSPMIGISQNKLTVQPLMKAVELTHAVSKAIDAKQFARAMELRDPEFAPAFDTYVAMNNLPPALFGTPAPTSLLARVPATIGNSSSVASNAGSDFSRPGSPALDAIPSNGLRVGILHIGAPAGGSNAATRTAALLALNRGHVPIAIYNGIPGLARGDASVLTRRTVANWTARGGSELGTNREQPNNQIGVCAFQLQRLGINALIFVGGFEAFTALHTLAANRDQYPALCIPMVHIPATISNNVPGTDYSLGSDTALNAIVDACDKLKQSASASRKRVFMVEVHGGNVGYLATMGGLAGGATDVYIPEEGINLARIQKDVDYLQRRYSAEQGTGAKEGRVFLRNENVSETYGTETLCAIMRTESGGLFDARSALLGHLQQGGSPSPLDRTRATRLAAVCIDWIERHAQPPREGSPEAKTGQVVYSKVRESACVVGFRGADLVFTPVDDLMQLNTDLKNRRALEAWWMPWRGLVPLLAGYAVSADKAAASAKSVPEPVAKL
ncbi:phosphofructokinase-domain-containing protein [Catenaria anguillulae PL171]|uniref:ATP-dependent 6-phosphofructokinase n=1 Tax=Catenaria anguillulae PL171 TaxID=765915 RepID=A0A1Y2HMX4_9FUNG|nr:phosphofructokinase-domain-containing protein [Catenaria anguillulae PL171]